jgi:hypothetical protein
MIDLGYYILGGPDGHTPIHVRDTLTWANWFEKSTEHRRVKLDKIGPVEVSTVFLGIDHNHARWLHNANNRPLLFETMAFVDVAPDRQKAGEPSRESWGDIQERCSTWAEAEAQHEAVCGAVRARLAGRW